MIPKVIHWCWFGRGKKSPLVEKCVESWKVHLPDWQIKEWNEDNFDVHSNLYVEEAYQEKKWAFVTDYVRLYALYNEGGVYMDSDVEVLKPLDRFLEDCAFTGYESSGAAVTGIMASEKNGKWIGDLLDYYQGRHFIGPNGVEDMANVIPITRIMKAHGMRLDKNEEDVQGYVHLYPADYFCPKQWHTNEILLTNNTYAIHHFTGTWLSLRSRIYRWFSNHGHPLIGYFVSYFFRKPSLVLLDIYDFICIKVLHLKIEPKLECNKVKH